ncbi:hypothetical protein [Bradyrhizobium sp. BR 10261]|nr:hypothetical protein [Bradyrhizobium sp. BR 10261]MBW7963557.1 hypothetical protein [Bradyrhizobium sp. BR 10261]
MTVLADDAPIEAALEVCGFAPAGNHGRLSDAAPNVDCAAWSAARKAAQP